MLAAEAAWGGEGGRPYLARAFSVADAALEEGGVRLDFLVQAVGPGTSRLATLEAGGGLWIPGPPGRPLAPPHEGAPETAGAVFGGGGIGAPPPPVWGRARLAPG